eukprot:TRINITY_DN67222_c3_g5_i1.p1 TRINITY_DN67222_c3_g5~~TRINITY_DN67222_c3_g5_i1.p1  ORF type:complete len:602 (+),score=72.79 TRINITY_DN67222_c3_g5_i1:35-1840(+)
MGEAKTEQWLVTPEELDVAFNFPATIFLNTQKSSKKRYKLLTKECYEQGTALWMRCLGNLRTEHVVPLLDFVQSVETPLAENYANKYRAAFVVETNRCKDAAKETVFNQTKKKLSFGFGKAKMFMQKTAQVVTTPKEDDKKAVPSSSPTNPPSTPTTPTSKNLRRLQDMLNAKQAAGTLLDPPLLKVSQHHFLDHFDCCEGPVVSSKECKIQNVGAQPLPFQLILTKDLQHNTHQQQQQETPSQPHSSTTEQPTTTTTTTQPHYQLDPSFVLPRSGEGKEGMFEFEVRSSYSRVGEAAKQNESVIGPGETATFCLQFTLNKPEMLAAAREVVILQFDGGLQVILTTAMTCKTASCFRTPLWCMPFAPFQGHYIPVAVRDLFNSLLTCQKITSEDALKAVEEFSAASEPNNAHQQAVIACIKAIDNKSFSNTKQQSEGEPQTKTPEVEGDETTVDPGEEQEGETTTSEKTEAADEKSGTDPAGAAVLFHSLLEWANQLSSKPFGRPQGGELNELLMQKDAAKSVFLWLHHKNNFAITLVGALMNCMCQLLQLHSPNLTTRPLSIFVAHFLFDMSVSDAKAVQSVQLAPHFALLLLRHYSTPS